MTPLVLVVAGTRPEWQKLACPILALRAAGVPTAFLWTGQHADPAMTTAFASGLGWPEPDGRLEWFPGEDRRVADWRRPERGQKWWRVTYGAGTAPAIVLVQGDTDSAVVGMRAGDRWRRDGTLIAHLEAGLRSWEADLPEETNRREIDTFADLLLCPSPLAAAQARVDTKADARIVVTGQTGLDALHAAVKAVPSPPPTSPPHALLTLHRAALADDPAALFDVLVGVGRAMRLAGLPVAYWPVHPRLQGERYAACFKYADEAGIRRCSPWSYGEMAAHLGGHDRPAIVISDSGGLVEESCYLGIPTVIVRPATERWELVARGDAALVRPEHAAERLPGVVADLVRAGPGARSGRAHARAASPYGDPAGRETPTKKVVAAIREALGPALLEKR